MTTEMKIAELESSGERELGMSDWVKIDQRHIDLFAEATGDHQWIHVDRERAAEGPFRGTIAHGYLSLSLLPALLDDVIEVSDAKVGINYGIERVRFTSPVPSGSEVRPRRSYSRASAAERASSTASAQRSRFGGRSDRLSSARCCTWRCRESAGHAGGAAGR